MTVAGQVDLRSATDDQLRTLVDTIRDAFPNELTEPFKVLAEVSRRLAAQHRREAEAGFREFAKMVDESPHPEHSAHLSADARAQAAFAMLDNFKRQARALAASPSSPASGVRVKHLDWGRDHIRDEWWGNPPAPFTGPGYLILADGRWCKRDGVRIWVLDQSGDVEAAKAAAQADYEARIRSALGEHP